MVAVSRCESYDSAAVEKAVAAQIEMLGGMERYVKPGERVMLKINLLMARTPEEVTTTHPAVVAAVAKLVKAAGGIPVIADSPGGPMNTQILSTAYKKAGYAKLSEETGTALNYNCKSREIIYEKGRRCKDYSVIEEFFGCGSVINICKLKTHAMTGFSGAVKNLFGLIPGLKKPEYHFRFPEKRDFCEMLVDFCEYASPALSIMDAVVSMDGNGPSGGTPYQSGLLFASDSPFELDLAAMDAAGFAPDEIFTCQGAIARGHCPDSVDKLDVRGEKLENVRFKNFKKPDSHNISFLRNVNPALKRFERVLSPRPEIIRKKCIGCNKCGESCPVKAIAIKEGKAGINYKKCTHCFCCQEMCPVHAVAIKKRGIFRL